MGILGMLGMNGGSVIGTFLVSHKILGKRLQRGFTTPGLCACRIPAFFGASQNSGRAVGCWDNAKQELIMAALPGKILGIP